MIAYTTWSFNLFTRVLIYALWIDVLCLLMIYLCRLYCGLSHFQWCSVEFNSFIFRAKILFMLMLRQSLHFAYWLEFHLYWICFILGSGRAKNNDMWRCLCDNKKIMSAVTPHNLLTNWSCLLVHKISSTTLIWWSCCSCTFLRQTVLFIFVILMNIFGEITHSMILKYL